MTRIFVIIGGGGDKVDVLKGFFLALEIFVAIFIQSET